MNSWLNSASSAAKKPQLFSRCYDLDMAIFRIYENNQPAQIQHFLEWSKEGVKENDLVFVSGNPGGTNRLNTVAQLEFIRDTDHGTFTPRLSFGVVRGYKENGKEIPFLTHIKGAFQRATENENRSPFQLPDTWLRQKQRMNLDTPFNFVSTNDIIGGNSGSPVINRKGEIVGLVFDVNLYGLGWGYVYEDRAARTISVDTRAIIEALRNVYDAGPLLKE